MGVIGVLNIFIESDAQVRTNEFFLETETCYDTKRLLCRGFDLRHKIRDYSRPSKYCGVAQLVERRIVNPLVRGSSPRTTAKFLERTVQASSREEVTAHFSD